MVSLEFRASSFAIGARRAPEAARVDARPSPGPPSIRDGDEASSIAFVSVKSGSCGVGASKNHLRTADCDFSLASLRFAEAPPACSCGPLSAKVERPSGVPEEGEAGDTNTPGEKNGDDESPRFSVLFYKPPTSPTVPCCPTIPCR